MDYSMMPSPENDNKIGLFSRAWQYTLSLPKRVKDNIVSFIMEGKTLGKDDPRRIIHALKVGIAITAVSLFYYSQSLFDCFGVSAIWAIITVIVIFEYSVGATIGKGINRTISTCVAGLLGVLAYEFAKLSGKTWEPIILATFGFIIVSIVTYMRFFPKLKARYDYGLRIFNLTLALVLASSYRHDGVITLVKERLSTIFIGCCIATLVCVFISPVWIGSELHNLIASNIEKLGYFLENFGNEYMQIKDKKSEEEEKTSSRLMYKSVLDTQSTEETMADMAIWEPSHGMFKFRHPWKQYLKIGVLTRQCAYRIEALNNYLNSDIQMPQEIQKSSIKEECQKLSSELGQVLKEVALDIKNMEETASVNVHLTKTRLIADGLKTLLQDTSLWENYSLLDVLPAATVASILIEIVECVENVIEGVHELAFMASFKYVDNVVRPQLSEKDGSHHVVLDIVEDGIDNNCPQNELLPVKLEKSCK